MNLKSQLKYLTDEDGPNIPLRTLALYCAVSHTTLSKWLNDKINVSEELQQQIQDGIKDFVLDVCGVMDDNDRFYYRYLQPEEYERQKLRDKYVLGK